MIEPRYITAGEEVGAQRLAAIDKIGDEMPTKITIEATIDGHTGDGVEVGTRGPGFKSGDEVGVGADQGTMKEAEGSRRRAKSKWEAGHASMCQIRVKVY